MQPIDPSRVQAKLIELNTSGNPGAPHWVVNEELRAITRMIVQGDKVTFDPNNGIPVKVFANTVTGEIKLFDARAFIVKT